jgi:rare lipoprotein A
VSVAQAHPAPPVAAVVPPVRTVAVAPSAAAPAQARPVTVAASTTAPPPARTGAPLALPPLPSRSSNGAVAAPVVVSRLETPVQPLAQVRQPVPAGGGFVVQAASFSSSANARNAARALEGDVQQAGSYFRVHTGPFATRGEAEASLAKVRAAGYRDARISTSG